MLARYASREDALSLAEFSKLVSEAQTEFLDGEESPMLRTFASTPTSTPNSLRRPSQELVGKPRGICRRRSRDLSSEHVAGSHLSALDLSPPGIRTKSASDESLDAVSPKGPKDEGAKVSFETAVSSVSTPSSSPPSNRATPPELRPPPNPYEEEDDHSFDSKCMAKRRESTGERAGRKRRVTAPSVLESVLVRRSSAPNVLEAAQLAGRRKSRDLEAAASSQSAVADPWWQRLARGREVRPAGEDIWV